MTEEQYINTIEGINSIEDLRHLLVLTYRINKQKSLLGLASSPQIHNSILQKISDLETEALQIIESYL